MQKTPHLPFHKYFTARFSNPITPRRCLQSLFHISHNSCFRKCQLTSHPRGDKRCHPKPLAFPSPSQNSAKNIVFLGGKTREFTPTMTVTKCTNCLSSDNVGQHDSFPNYLDFWVFSAGHMCPPRRPFAD